MTDKDNNSPKISHPLAKAVIGSFAGFCAIVFPMLSSAIVDFESFNRLIFSPTYQVLIAVFSLIVGLVVVILDWGKQNEPKMIFMLALGVPAMLSGTIHTGIDRASIQKYEKEISAYEQISKNPQSVPTFSGELFEISDDTPSPSGGSWKLPEIFSTNVAFADETKKKFVPKGGAKEGLANVKDKAVIANAPSLKPNYLVVLDQATTLAVAREKEKSLNDLKLSAKAVSTGKGAFLIIQDLPPLGLTETLEKIEKIKKLHQGISPGLIKINSK